MCFSGSGGKLSSIQSHSVSSRKWFRMHEIVVNKQIVQYVFIQIHLWSKIFNVRKMDRGECLMNFQAVSFALTLPDRKCLHAQLFSHAWFFVTPWTVAWQAPLFMGSSKQEYWSGLPCPPPWDLHDPGIEPASLASPVLAGGIFTDCATYSTLTRDLLSSPCLPARLQLFCGL